MKKDHTMVSKEVIVKAIAGDSDAFTVIYQTYYNRVYFMNIQYFKDDATAQDILQKVFIKVYEQIHTLQAPEAFHSWLYTIVYRECQNHNRRKWITVELDEEQQANAFLDYQETAVMDKLETERIQEMIAQSLDEMDTTLRVIGYLRFYEELKIQEIADILAIPKGTVATKLSKVKQKLKHDLIKNDIHINFSVLFVSPTLLIGGYTILLNQHTLSKEAANEVLTVVTTGSVATAMSFTTAMKVAISSLLLVGAVGGFVLLNQNAGNAKEILYLPSTVTQEEDKALAKIIKVSYDEEWRKDAFNITVETNNDNYDKILVNEVASLEIIENGDYAVSLVKDGNVIDSRKIEISNIDRHSPNAQGKEMGEEYNIYLSEDISGIDEKSIVYYRNGVQSFEYKYDASKQMITIANDPTSLHEFRVSDCAGNVLEVIVKVVK